MQYSCRICGKSDDMKFFGRINKLNNLGEHFSCRNAREGARQLAKRVAKNPENYKTCGHCSHTFYIFVCKWNKETPKSYCPKCRAGL